MPITRAYIALGSNLNDPFLQVQQAISSLKALSQTSLVSTSSLYRNPPLGPQDQPEFINAVAAIDTSLAPLELLAELKKIEVQQGKVKVRHWGERIIDLDLILYGDEIINNPDLIVPHPGLKQRNFVLVPLAEIAPDLILPDGEAVQACLQKVSVETVLKI